MKKTEERNANINFEVTDPNKYLKFCSKNGWMLENLKEINYATFSVTSDLWIFAVRTREKGLDCKYILPAEEVLLVCEEEK